MMLIQTNYIPLESAFAANCSLFTKASHIHVNRPIIFFFECYCHYLHESAISFFYLLQELNFIDLSLILFYFSSVSEGVID